MKAVKEGEVADVQKLLQKGADVNFQDGAIRLFLSFLVTRNHCLEKNPLKHVSIEPEGRIESSMFACPCAGS